MMWEGRPDREIVRRVRVVWCRPETDGAQRSNGVEQVAVSQEFGLLFAQMLC